jgi:hypothetical protein
VIHGSEDNYVPVANAVALAEAIPGAKLRVLDNAGHLVFIERAADVNREVVTFLKPRGGRKKREEERAPGSARFGEWLRSALRAIRSRLRSVRG